MHNSILTNFSDINRKSFVLMLIPILVGTVGFTFHITGDLYGDEFATYTFAMNEKPKFMDGERASTSLIFLYFLKLGVLITDNPWGIRLHSVIFGIATIIMTGLLAKLLLGSNYQIVAMWIASFSPMLIEFGGEGRPCAMMAFWGITFLYCLIVFERNENMTNSILLGIVAAVGCLSRSIFAANLLFGLIYYLIKRRKITKLL